MVNHTKEEEVDFSTRSRNYSNHESSPKGKETLNPYNSLHIEKPKNEMVPRIPNVVYKRASHNPNAQAVPNYSIVEDLAQMPCTMFALKVLQSFPMQQATLLFAIGAIDSLIHLVMKFYATEVKHHLPYHVAFQINIVYAKHIIHRTVIDEGALVCFMYLSC
jgi:hypothetical protein